MKFVDLRTEDYITFMSLLDGDVFEADRNELEGFEDEAESLKVIAIKINNSTAFDICNNQAFEVKIKYRNTRVTKREATIHIE